MSNVPAFILDAFRFGILPVSNVPDVILPASISGILNTSNVSDVILLADKLGILSTPNMSDVILLADKLGISLSVKLLLLPPPPSDEIDTPFTVKPPVIASVPLISIELLNDTSLKKVIPELGVYSCILLKETSVPPPPPPPPPVPIKPSDV